MTTESTETTESVEIAITLDLTDNSLILLIPQPSGNRTRLRITPSPKGLAVIQNILIARQSAPEPAPNIAAPGNPLQDEVDSWLKNNSPKRIPTGESAAQNTHRRRARTSKPSVEIPDWLAEALDELSEPVNI